MKHYTRYNLLHGLFMGLHKYVAFTLLAVMMLVPQWGFAQNSYFSDRNCNYYSGDDIGSSSWSTSWQSKSKTLTAGNYDRFDVYLTANQKYTFSLCSDDGGSTNFDSYMALYGPSYGCYSSSSTCLAYNDDGCSSASIITYIATETGWKSLFITGYSSSYSGSYTLRYKYETVATHSLTVNCNPTAGGSVSPSSGTYAQGATVSITATPASGYGFTGWTLSSGTGASLSSTTSNPTTFTMGSSNATVTANFVASPSNSTCSSATSLSCGASLSGTTVGTPGSAHGTGASVSNYGVWYTFTGDGGETTISTTAGSGYDHRLVICSGSCVSLTNLYSVDSHGTGGTESQTFLTENGTTYYVYIAHYADGNTTTGTFTISRTCVNNYTVTAQAYPQNVGCTVKINNGSTTQSSTSASVSGSTTLTATAGTGYQFVNWTNSDGNVVSTSSAYTFTPSASATYQANFTKTTATPLPWTEGFEEYTHNNKAYLKGEWATPLRRGAEPCVNNYSYGASHGNYSLEMSAAGGNYTMAVLPQFAHPLNKLTISFNYARGNTSSGYTAYLGYVTNPSDANTFISLTTISVPAQVNSYSSFSYDLSTNSNSPSSSAYRLAIRYTQSSSGGDSWYFDDFSVQPIYTVSASSNPSNGGNVSINSGTAGSSASANIVYGDPAEFTANPASGYEFVKWTEGGSDVSTNTTYTINSVTANHTLVANFAQLFTLSCSALSNGSITVTQGGNTLTLPTSVAQGASVSISTTPATDYHLSSLYYTTASAPSTQVAITGGSFSMPADDVTIHATFAPNELHYVNSGNTVYLSWDEFVDNVQSVTNYSGKTIYLDKDISVNRIVPGTTWNSGGSYLVFKGTFDGQQHTITINHTTTQAFTGLFRYTYGATIKNLRLEGTINSSYNNTASFIGMSQSTTVIENCISNVTINSTAEVGVAGMVGGASNNITFRGCAFIGTLNGTSSSQNGGFVGYQWNNGSHTYTNCLFAPTSVSSTLTNVYTFDEYNSSSDTHSSTFTNCYFTEAFGEEQAKQAYTITGVSPVTVAMYGTATNYNVSGLTSYSSNQGLVYNDGSVTYLYAGDGDNVKLTLSGSSTGYKADHGTLTDNSTYYTLAMEAYNTEISARVRYNVTCNPATHGSIASDQSPTAIEGTTVTITATPDSGYGLATLEYSADGGSTWTAISFSGNSGSFTMPSHDVNVEATFEQLYTITCTIDPDGTVSASPAAASPGTTIDITATPNTGYVLTALTYSSDGGITWANIPYSPSGSDHIGSFPMPAANVTVTATFTAIPTYTVSADSGISDGTLSFSGGGTSGTSISVEDGTTVTITATPASGFVTGTITATAGGSSVALSGSGNTRTFTMPADNVTVTATFDCTAPAAPTFSPSAGSYNNTQSVTLSCATTGATIYYTTDGSTPTSSSTPYNGAISVSSSKTIRAIAYIGSCSSTESAATYVIGSSGSTDCTTNSENFNNTTAAAYNASTYYLPSSWCSYNSSSSGNVPRVSNHDKYSYITDHDGNYLLLTTTGDGQGAYAIAPQCSNITSVEFYYRYENTNQGTFTVGYVTNNSGYSTYKVLETPTKTTTWTQYTLTQSDIATINNNNGYLAFRHVGSSSTYYSSAIDDLTICVENTSSYTVQAATSTGIASAYVAAGDTFSGTATSVSVTEHGSATFQAKVEPNYAFDGWYNGSTLVSTSLTYVQSNITGNLTLTAKATSCSCPTPTNVAVSNVAPHSATVSWTGNADSYTVRYSTATITGTTLDPVFEDDFESGIDDWTTYAVGAYTGESYVWHQALGSNLSSAQSDSYVAVSRSYGNAGDQSVDNWLVTPEMTLGDVLKFWVNGDNAGWQEYYEVYVSTGTNAISDFELVATPDLAPGDGSWAERTVDLSAYAGQTGYIAIRHTDEGKDWLLVDDFGVYNTINTYSYGGWTTVSPNPTTNSCQLTGLSDETIYQVQVQANCGSGCISDWTTGVTFTTPEVCVAPSGLASSATETSATLSWTDSQDTYDVQYRKVYFKEGFEGGSLPTGWTAIDANNDGLTWSVGHATAHSGHNGAYNESYVYSSDASVSTTPNDYLVSPLLDLRGTLRVWLSGYPRQSSNYSEHFAIYISTTGSTASDFTTTLVAESITTNEYVEYTANLSAYAGQQGYIAIRHFNCTDQYYLYVDDFGLYGSEDWTTITVTDATTTLTGLTPGTEYEWQVRGLDCSGSTDTDWSESDYFTTDPAYTITVATATGGSGTYTFMGTGVASTTANTALVSANGMATINVAAAPGYTFMCLTDDDNSDAVVATSPSFSFTIDPVIADRHFTAHFVNQSASDWTTAVTYNPGANHYETDGSGNVTIKSANGLAWLISVVNGLNFQNGSSLSGKTVTLTSDIDMSAHVWVPIGSAEHPFGGTFEGNGHVVKGIHRATDIPHQGMFGYAQDATIQNAIVNNTLSGNCITAGTVAGTLAETSPSGSATMCNVEGAGSITGGANTISIGGLVGTNGGTIHSSFAVSTLTGGASTTQLGGLVGNNTGDLYNSYSNATYAGTSATKGGLVGTNSGTVENCYAAGIASGVSAFAGSNSGTIQYCYTNAIGSGYIGTNSTAPTGSATYGAVQSSIKHLDYMYRDNLITKNTNSYVGDKDAIADGIDVYVDRHIPVWNGLVSALNQWVKEKNQVSDASSLYYNKDFTAWYRPLTTQINSDLPVLGFDKDSTLVTTDGKYLQYSASLDHLLSEHASNTAYMFHYGHATGVTQTPGANVHVYVQEDAVLLQATSASAFSNTTVGVTFDNSDHGQHAYDFWGNKLNYDWHLLSTPLYRPLTGATHSNYVASGDPYSYVDVTNIGGYFPDGLITSGNPAVGGTIKWDFYAYYEPHYHWINLKRNKKNHYHQDGGAIIPYNEPDQDLGGNTAYYIEGKGYEMAINQNTFMNATGTLNRGNVSITLTNQEPDDIQYASGWNLVGNPYQAYLDIDKIGKDPIYTYDADQGIFVPYTKTSSENPAILSQYIHPHQAFFVHADSDGETLTFTQGMATTTSTAGSYYREKLNYPLVNLFAEDDAGHRDLTVVEFHRPELGGAPKFDYMRTAPFSLAAHYAGTSYGILFATDDLKRIPVRFQTTENGPVTLTWSTYNGEFYELRLIDNKLGVDYNMLASNSYTFDATIEDYASRFYIVYDCSGTGVDENEDGSSSGSGTFAYIGTDGNIVIDIDAESSHGASLQVVDVLGRVLYSTVCRDGVHTVSTNGLAKGVYLLRLTNGNMVKTQKIVVR